MADETKKALEELVRMCEDNDLAKAFLTGFKSGMQAGKEGGEENDQHTS